MQRWPENWCGHRLRTPLASHLVRHLHLLSVSPPPITLTRCLPMRRHATAQPVRNGRAPPLSIYAAGGAFHGEQGVVVLPTREQ